MSFDPSAARSGSVFSDVPSYVAGWVCYINGVEIPVMAWQVDCQIWQVPSFTIHCLPDPAIQRLGTEDRVPVQIFYLDHWAEDKPKFRLLVDGEIIGWHFSSSVGARTIAFSCLSHIQIFQQLYFFFMTNVDDIVASRDPGRLASGFSTPGLLYPYALFHQGLLATSSQLQQATPRYNARGQAEVGASTASSAAPTTEFPEDTAPILCAYELVTNVVKGVISSQVPNDRRAVPMMNFFARHIRKTRFHNRWVRLPLLEDAEALNDRKGVFPIFNAARNDEALNAMQRQVVSQVGSSGPVWNLFQQVLGLVYMEIAMIPNPVCVRVKLADFAPNQPEEGKILRRLTAADDVTATYRRGLITTGRVDSDPSLRAAQAEAQAQAEAARTASEAARAAETERLAEEARRTLASRPGAVNTNAMTTEVTRRQQAVTAAQTRLTELREYYRTRPGSIFRGLDGVQRNLILEQEDRVQEAQRELNYATRNLRRAEQRQTAAVNAALPPPPTPQQIQQTAEQTQQDVERATRENYARIVARTTEQLAEEGARDLSITAAAEPIRLAQYFVKPNFFFGETPACNVILPSMIDSWTFDESYINQPTRVYVNDSVMTQVLRSSGSNREFMLHALTVGWPEEANALMHHKVGAEEQVSAEDHGGESGKNLLVWPEEFYKGPVVARAALPSWFQMLRQFSNRRPFVEPPRPSPLQPETPERIYEPPPPSPLAPAGAAAATPAAATPAAPATPGSANASTDQNTQRGLTRISVQNLPAYAIPTKVFIGGRTTGRLVTRLAVGGGRAERVCLQRGSGLDPAMYVAPQITAPWPLRRNPAAARPPNRRGRSAQTNTPPAWVQVYDRPTRDAIMLNALAARLRTQAPFSALPPEHLTVAMYGFAWLIVQETGMNLFYSWALANQKQYRRSPRRHWTINPFGGGPIAYVAATSLDESIDSLWQHFSAQPEYMAALNSMLTGQTPPALTARIRAAGGSVSSPFWARFGPIRPDLFYIHLMDVQYAEGATAAIGVSRTSESSGMQAEFVRAKSILDSGQTPEAIAFTAPISAEYQRPLYPTADADLLSIPFTDVRATGERQPEGATPGQNTGNDTGGNRGAGTLSSAEQIEQGDEFSKLFELYAQYEYLKQRYGQRALGANLRFNPYILVGFPSMLFDSMRTGMHSVGYVVGVSHSASVGSGGSSISTAVRMQFCRTMQEFIYDVRTDAARFNGRITSAPAEIIDEIRAVIQDDQKAEEFYQKLLYGGTTPRGTPACFRWEAVMNFAKNIAGEDIYIEGDTNSVLVEEERAERESRQAAAQAGESTGEQPRPSTEGDRQAAAAASAEERERIPARNNLEDLGPLTPKLNTAYADAFDNYHIAMQLASRPACSLEDFIRFWHAGQTVQDLINAGVVSEPRNDLAYTQLARRDVVRENANGTQTRATVYRSSAVYYGRIFRLRAGPGQAPTEDQRGYTAGPEILPTAKNEGVPNTYPETRANWDAEIELYRRRVRNLISPTT